MLTLFKVETPYWYGSWKKYILNKWLERQSCVGDKPVNYEHLGNHKRSRAGFHKTHVDVSHVTSVDTTAHLLMMGVCHKKHPSAMFALVRPSYFVHKRMKIALTCPDSTTPRDHCCWHGLLSTETPWCGAKKENLQLNLNDHFLCSYHLYIDSLLVEWVCPKLNTAQCLRIILMHA